MLWMGKQVHPYTVTLVQVGDKEDIEKKVYGWTWLSGRGQGRKQFQTPSHFHIGCVQSVLAPWYAVDGHMGTLVPCSTSAKSRTKLLNITWI
jgi:hypothetical protein